MIVAITDVCTLGEVRASACLEQALVAFAQFYVCCMEGCLLEGRRDVTLAAPLEHIGSVV